MSNTHANLGASNSAIWLNCFEAGRRMRSVKSNAKPSVYAAQGTVAHGLCETGLLFGMGEVNAMLGHSVVLDGFTIEIDQNMIDAVAVYVSYVEKMTLPTDQRFLEERVSLDAVVYGSTALTSIPEMLFGTADCIIVSADGTEVSIIDYKHGAGVPVEADTTQGLYYGVGAVYGFAPNAQLITVAIVQPRAPHADGPIRTKTYTRLDVENFIERIRRAVKSIVSGAGGYASGKWCRFCPLAGQCPELFQTNLAVTKGDFMATPAEGMLPKPGLLTGDDLSYVLDHKDDIRRWLDAVEQESVRRLSSSETVKDYKLVAKRARKAWFDDDMYVVKAHVGNKLGTSVAQSIIEGTLLSPAKVRDMLSPADFDELVTAGIVTNTSSGLTLAHTSDRRPAVNVADAARRDFETLTIIEGEP